MGFEDNAHKPESERGRFVIPFNAGEVYEDTHTAYQVRPSDTLFDAGLYEWQYINVQELNSRLDQSVGEVVLVWVHYSTRAGVDYDSLYPNQRELLDTIIKHYPANAKLDQFMYGVLENSVSVSITIITVRKVISSGSGPT